MGKGLVVVSVLLMRYAPICQCVSRIVVREAGRVVVGADKKRTGLEHDQNKTNERK